MKKKKRPFEVSSPANRDKKKSRDAGKAASKRSDSQSATSKSSSSRTASSKSSKSKSNTGFFADPGVRETIESIVVAVILALLFRAYEAEAFVIPTGSMAPTLQGRHIDLVCKECGHNFRVGASGENPDRKPMRVSAAGKIEVDPDTEWYTGTATCPICRYTHDLNRNFTGWQSNEDSFYGDRIIVSKFAYELNDPKRWDVIVFKYPANPKQNYIKRLIGLPGETIKLEFGNVYVRNETGGFDIARKPHHKLKVMLQLVDDTYHIAKSLKKVGWPTRWNQWQAPEAARDWTIDQSGAAPKFELAATDSTKWLRYLHIVPVTHDWVNYISQGELPPRLKDFKGQLIGDFYSYNFFVPQRLRQSRSLDDWMNGRINQINELVPPSDDPEVLQTTIPVNEDGRYLSAQAGVHWVGDLAVECNVEVKSKTGKLKLDLVRSGIHFTCSIDVETGLATLSTSSKNVSFVSKEQEATETPQGKTPLRGLGNYRIRFANCDEKLFLWVNEKVIRFDGPTSYLNHVEAYPTPKYSAEDPGDAQPAGIGGEGVSLSIDRLKILRDVFYINSRTGQGYYEFEYQNHATNVFANSYMYSVVESNQRSIPIRRIFENPLRWDSEEADSLFRSQIHDHPNYYYELGPDQFMPLGDNSPSSQDARAWDHGHYFDRRFLIGKALFIYWPHAWRQPFFFPNFRRMGFIR